MMASSKKSVNSQTAAFATVV